MSSAKEVHDLGSGAGFPGIIFAIRYPERRVVLYEKLLKKQSFLSAVVTQLGLRNVTLQGAMPEEPFQGLFLARAVFPRPDLFKFLRKRLRPGSQLIVNSGGSTEVEAAPAGFLLEKKEVYTLPEDAGPRRVESFLYVPRGTN
jgi:16S rRNA (guanine527-N7)-methyltransferase